MLLFKIYQLTILDIIYIVEKLRRVWFGLGYIPPTVDLSFQRIIRIFIFIIFK